MELGIDLSVILTCLEKFVFRYESCKYSVIIKRSRKTLALMVKTATLRSKGGSCLLSMKGLKGFDFTTSVCNVEFGKDRQRIVWF